MSLPPLQAAPCIWQERDSQELHLEALGVGTSEQKVEHELWNSY